MTIKPYYLAIKTEGKVLGRLMLDSSGRLSVDGEAEQLQKLCRMINALPVLHERIWPEDQPYTQSFARLVRREDKEFPEALARHIQDRYGLDVTLARAGGADGKKRASAQFPE